MDATLRLVDQHKIERPQAAQPQPRPATPGASLTAAVARMMHKNPSSKPGF